MFTRRRLHGVIRGTVTTLRVTALSLDDTSEAHPALILMTSAHDGVRIELEGEVPGAILRALTELDEVPPGFRDPGCTQWEARR